MHSPLVSRIAALLFLSTLLLPVSSKPIKTLKQFDMRGALESYLKTARFGYGPSSSRRPGLSSTSSRGPSPSPHHITTTDQFTKYGFSVTTTPPVAPTYGSDSQPGLGGGWVD